MATVYHIPDEPRPGGLARMTVSPFWPLLCVMFVGAGASWGWFVLNGIAMGSPTRKREQLVAVVGLLGNAALLLGILEVYSRLESGSETALPYLFLIALVWKLGVSYTLYMLQARSFDIFEYYGGPVQNGLMLLVAFYVAWRMVIAPMLSDAAFLRLVLS